MAFLYLQTDTPVSKYESPNYFLVAEISVFKFLSVLELRVHFHRVQLNILLQFTTENIKIYKVLNSPLSLSYY